MNRLRGVLNIEAWHLTIIQTDAVITISRIHITVDGFGLLWLLAIQVLSYISVRVHYADNSRTVQAVTISGLPNENPGTAKPSHKGNQSSD